MITCSERGSCYAFARRCGDAVRGRMQAGRAHRALSVEHAVGAWACGYSPIKSRWRPLLRSAMLAAPGAAAAGMTDAKRLVGHRSAPIDD